MARITNENPMSLSNLGKGEVIRRFDLAMADALSNIKDKSTPQKKARKIIVEASIIPSHDREGGTFSVVVNKKFPTSEPYVSEMIIAQDSDGTIVAHESLPLDKEEVELSDI